MNNQQIAYTFSTPYEVPMPMINPGLAAMPGFTPCIIQNGMAVPIQNGFTPQFPNNVNYNPLAFNPNPFPPQFLNSARLSPLVLPSTNISSMSPPSLILPPPVTVSSPQNIPAMSQSVPPTQSSNTYLDVLRSGKTRD